MPSRRLFTVLGTSAAALAAAAAIGLMTTQKSVSAIAASAELTQATPVCVFGWSKDSCEGRLVGPVAGSECRRVVKEEHVTCLTRTVYSGELSFPIKQGIGACSDDSRCDQTPQLDGKIQLRGNFIFGDGNCPFRGAWEGEWRLYDNQGNFVAFGTGSGTLGTGSHRSIGPCFGPDAFCGQDCESCYDVRFHFGQWYVGLEGALRGEVFAGEWTSSTITVMLSGTLSTPGGADGPFNFGSWAYCGTSDGVVLAKCDG